MEPKGKELRSGYTTGACAAAAAKAATLLAVRSQKSGVRSHKSIDTVDIPLPDGSRVKFRIHDAGFRIQDNAAYASVIKDAGDDPDVTHGAEIRAEASVNAECGMRMAPGHADAEWLNPEIIIKGGKGVGTITKPGLAIPVGEPAINPVPRKMIMEAVREAFLECGMGNGECGMNRSQSGLSSIPNSAFRIPHLEVTISVPQGEELAKKTLNHRLGIVGGISILGTTGIVKPLSEAAWTATITSSFDVAKALGREEVVLSTGRTSEKAHQQKFGFPEDCYAMMGDYTEFSLRDAKEHGFRRVHLSAQWAKMIKIAMATPQTHVRHGVLEAKAARDFLVHLGINMPKDTVFNTSREIYDFIRSKPGDQRSEFHKVCEAARRYCEGVTGGIPVSVHLVSYEGEIVAESE